MPPTRSMRRTSPKAGAVGVHRRRVRRVVVAVMHRGVASHARSAGRNVTRCAMRGLGGRNPRAAIIARIVFALISRAARATIMLIRTPSPVTVGVRNAPKRAMRSHRASNQSSIAIVWSGIVTAKIARGSPATVTRIRTPSRARVAADRITAIALRRRMARRLSRARSKPIAAAWMRGVEIRRHAVRTARPRSNMAISILISRMASAAMTANVRSSGSNRSGWPSSPVASNE